MVHLVVLAIQQDAGESFAKTVANVEDPIAFIFEGAGQRYQLDVLAGDPRLNPLWDEAIHHGTALALLVRFLDVLSVEKLGAIYKRIKDSDLPIGVFILRNEGEADFKMSCPHCGQKLWVRDIDAGKRGRCPNCKRAYDLPVQSELVRDKLGLPLSVEIQQVVESNSDECRQAVSKFLGVTMGDIVEIAGGSADDASLNQTMRVQIPDDLKDG